MFYIIYVSFATAEPSDESLHELLKLAQDRNRERGVTGMLIYKRGMYVQMLEGEEQVVRSLFEEISKDPRHYDVNVFESGEERERSFPDWSMGFCNMEQRDDLPDLKQYMEAVLNKTSLSRDLPRAHEFLKAFSRIEDCRCES